MSSSHWDRVWSDREPNEVSWFQSEPRQSLAWIEQVTDPANSIIDVGAGASLLVDRLLTAGYSDLTVVDLAPAALDTARHRLGDVAAEVNWIVGDVTRLELDRQFDLWHDRAVLHFLIEDDDRTRYRSVLRQAVRIGGHVILSTFTHGAPDQCSGLAVRHYDSNDMQQLLGSEFEALDHCEERHETPRGDPQLFLYGLFRRTAAGGDTKPRG